MKEKLSDNEAMQKRSLDVDVSNKEGESMNTLLDEKTNQDDKNGDYDIDNDGLSNNIKSNDDEVV